MLWDSSVREMDDFCYKEDIYLDFVAIYSPYVPQGFLLLGNACWSLVGHFSQNKTIEHVEHKFYWSSLKRDVAKIVGQYRTCQLAKQKNRLSVLTLLSRYSVALDKM